MAMLERMVKPSAHVSAATTVGGKRKVRGAGNGGGGGGVAGVTDARNLLHKLERKVRREERGSRRVPRGLCVGRLVAPNRRHSELLSTG